MTNGFTRRKEQSKEEIRKAAWELFSQFGVEKVTIVEIAHKAGVSQATIYNNFGSKEALAREFVTSAADRLANRVQEVLIPNQTYAEKMAALMGFLSEVMMQERRSLGNAVMFTSSDDLLNDPEIKKIRDSAQEKMTDLLLGLVQEGKDQGQISQDLSEAACRIYFTAFMDIFTQPQLQRQYAQNPQVVQDLGQLMMFGLSGSVK